MTEKEQLVAMGQISVEEAQRMFIQILSDSVDSKPVRASIVLVMKSLLQNEFRQKIKDITAQIAESKGLTRK